MFSRRNFLQLSGGSAAALALGSVSMETGCNLSQSAWFQEAIKILELVGPAVTGILAILGLPVPAVIGQVIQALLALLQQYQNAPVDQQATLLAQIEAAAKLVQSTVNEVLTAIQVKNEKLKNKIIALVNFVVGEIAAVLAIIPAAQVGKAAMRAVAQKVPAKSSGEFKKIYNAIMTNPVDDTDPVVVNANQLAKSALLK